MLSRDELTNGRVFILKLWDVAGVSCQWVERLSGDTARRWYGIYRNSDWNALRAEASNVFRTAVTDTQAEVTRRSNRCVYIHTTDVKVEDLGRSPSPASESIS